MREDVWSSSFSVKGSVIVANFSPFLLISVVVGTTSSKGNVILGLSCVLLLLVAGSPDCVVFFSRLFAITTVPHYPPHTHKEGLEKLQIL